MNKKFNVVTIICCLLLFANLLFLCFEVSSNESLNIDDELMERDRMAAYNLNQLQIICNQQLLSENIRINNGLLLDENGDKIPLKTISAGSDKFFIRFNDAGCTSCIEEFIQKLPQTNEFIQSLGADNVVILLNTDNPRFISVFRKQHKLNCLIYALPIGRLGIPIEQQDEIVAYYYFVLSKDNTIDDCFIPIKGLDARNRIYFDSIKRKLKK